MVGNLVLRRRASRAVKRDFQRISDDTPPKIKVLNIVIPILMRFYRFVSNWSIVSRIKPHKGVRYQMKCYTINDVKLFLTVYRKIYWRKFLTFTNRISHSKNKCIRIAIIRQSLIISLLV